MEWMTIEVTIIDYSFYKFLKSCVIIEAKIIKPNVVLRLYSKKQDQELTVAQIMNSLLPNSDLN